MRIVAILLAAGSARRFGGDKLMHALPHEVPIAVQALRHLKSVFAVGDIVAVVRPDTGALAGRLREEGCTVVPCENADEGMGASLACGARAAGAAGGYLVALADMPFIRPSSIEAVRDAVAGGAAFAVPFFHARRGHPVGIAGEFGPQLAGLRGDEGARGLLQANPARVLKVPVGDPGVIRDIDTPGDLSLPIVV